LQPIAAVVYCNHQVPPAGGRRQAAGDRLNASVNSAHDDANTFDRQLKSFYLRWFGPVLRKDENDWVKNACIMNRKV